MNITSISGFFDLIKDASPFLGALLSLPFLKNFRFTRKKANHLKSVFDDYKDFLSIEDKKFIENEINADVMFSLTKVRNLKYRKMAVYIRSNSIIELALWKWPFLLPHINFKNQRFYIRYKGKYLKNRISSKLISLFYLCCGGYYWHVLYKMSESYAIYAAWIVSAIFFAFGLFIWNMFPSKNKINKINKSLIKIDTRNYKP